MREVILLITCSLDGYIADEEGNVDWLLGEDEYDFDSFLAKTDTLLMGHKTYRQVLGFGKWPYEGKECYVFTTRSPYPEDEKINDWIIPQDWIALRDIAEFFYRPEENLYGILAWREPEYDGITMGIDAFVWGWGAALGDYKNYKVKGFLNSEKGVKALEYYKELNSFSNPEWKYNYLDTERSSNQPMIRGEVAMAMCYLSIAPELLDPAINKRHDDTGFFTTPSGPVRRATSLGGQGISIVSYSKKKYNCFKFLKWFIREDVQEKWGELGGLSCNSHVLNSEEFLSASPVNRPYRDSIEIIMDFWAVPEYAELLSVSQKYWDLYINKDEISAAESMRMIEYKWEEIFDQAGYYKE